MNSLGKNDGRIFGIMKVRHPFIVGLVLAGVVLLVSIMLVHQLALSTTKSASIYLRGYTNTVGGADMTVFEVINHTRTPFVCFVMPRSSEASKGGRSLSHDTTFAATPGALPPRGVFVFSVPSPPDTNLWRVSVQLQEIDAGRSKMQRALAGVLRLVGVHFLDVQTYNLTSPAFGKSKK